MNQLVGVWVSWMVHLSVVSGSDDPLVGWSEVDLVGSGFAQSGFLLSNRQMLY